MKEIILFFALFWVSLIPALIAYHKKKKSKDFILIMNIFLPAGGLILTSSFLVACLIWVAILGWATVEEQHNTGSKTKKEP